MLFEQQIDVTDDEQAEMARIGHEEYEGEYGSQLDREDGGYHESDNYAWDCSPPW